MGENVRVVVRCRPMSQKEQAMNCRKITEIENCVVSVTNPMDVDAPAKSFTFDSVYDSTAPTETIYNDICYSLVENVLEGYNGTIFAYGQTGCGKTHTMQGPTNCFENQIGNPNNGIIPRCFDHIFEAISVSNGVRYLAIVSYLEIYNENIRDLLSPNESINSNHALKEIPGIGITVPTLSTHTVLNASDCHKLLNMGNRNRMIGATLMNATSSRSHSIFTISLEQINESKQLNKADALLTIGGIRRGKLNLVDLAGSERQNKTGAAGDRLKEATKINLSLSALGNVISALVDGKTKHVPYRDSKLTRLLQDSLGGNTKTLMVSCISPADTNYDETLSTLRYASRAKNISNKPKINEDPKDAKLREYQEEIIKLKQLLNESHQPMVAADTDSDAEISSSSKDQWLESERLKLRLEMEDEMRELKEEHKKQQSEREERYRDIEKMRQHYEAQLKKLSYVATNNTNEQQSDENLQLQARNRIDLIKQALIGGERANDIQLKNVLKKRKIDAQRRLSALAHALSRVEQSEDRNLLQVHYTTIQQELIAKNELLKAYRQKIKVLEREVSDLQSEFQLDRADYLESIRRLERNLKFYQQLISKALPILRKDGKYWEPEEILENSSWNDDLKTWKLPETSMYSFKLPPAEVRQSFSHKKTTIGNKPLGQPALGLHHKDETFILNDGNIRNGDASSNEIEANILEMSEKNKADILNNYFRSNRSKHVNNIQQTKSLQAWKDFAQRAKRGIGDLRITSAFDSSDNSSIELPVANDFGSSNQVLLSTNDTVDDLNRTWAGISLEKRLGTLPSNNETGSLNRYFGHIGKQHILVPSNIQPQLSTLNFRRPHRLAELQWDIR